MTYFVQKKKKGRVGTGNQAVGGNVLTFEGLKVIQSSAFRQNH